MPLSKFIPTFEISAKRLQLCAEISKGLTNSEVSNDFKTKVDQYNEILEKDIKTALDLIEYLKFQNGSEKFLQSSKQIKPEPSSIDSKKAADKSAAPKTEKPASKPTAKPTQPVDIGRMDFRVGKIIDIKTHPDADTLFVETVDIGDKSGVMRTVCSGLVNKIPMEEIRGKVAIFCCNLKPVKMRGIVSEAMIMCSSNGEKCEILEPPHGCKLGDSVTCPGYNHNPDQMLNPKEKVWETVQPNLRVDASGNVVYCGTPVVVGSAGNLRSATLRDCKVS